MEKRSGLVIQAQATRVVGASEPATPLALATAIRRAHRVTVGGDTGDDCRVTDHAADTLHLLPVVEAVRHDTRHAPAPRPRRCGLLE